MKIESVVEGVFKQLKEHGLSEYTLQQNMWSYYRAIIKFHTASGTDEYSPVITRKLSEIQCQRYERGEISRKFYRAFVTAEFRIRTFAETGSVDFSNDSPCYFQIGIMLWYASWRAAESQNQRHRSENR